MWPWNRRDITPVGVEIDGSAVRLAQLEFRAGRSPAARILSRSLPADLAEGDAQTRCRASIQFIRGMLREGGFGGSRVVAALPDHLLHLRTLRLVRDGSVDPDTAVRRECSGLFPFELAQAHLHYIEAGQTRCGPDSRDEVIVAASRRDQVDRFLREFDRVGVRLAGLDVAPFAAYRGCRWGAADDREIHAVLELRQEMSYVVIGRGTRVRFIKRIAVGADQLADALARRLCINKEDALKLRRRLLVIGPTTEGRAVHRAAAQACRPLLESLAAEVSACLRYYCVSFRGRAMECLLLSGADAADPQLAAVLGSAVSVPVRVANPLAAFVTSVLMNREPSEWSTALGLALKSAVPSPVPLAAVACKEPAATRTHALA